MCAVPQGKQKGGTPCYADLELIYSTYMANGNDEMWSAPINFNYVVAHEVSSGNGMTHFFGWNGKSKIAK